jgi:hypothetical protein
VSYWGVDHLPAAGCGGKMPNNPYSLKPTANARGDLALGALDLLTVVVAVVLIVALSIALMR